MKHVILITALFMITALAAAKEVKTGALTLNVPDTWVQEKVKSAMRAAQFIVPGPDAKQEEAGELVIFYFGPQQGGTVDANIQRWVGQFVEKGRDVKKDQGDSANGQYNLVNITGTYNKPFGPPFAQQSKPSPGYQMLAITVNTPKGNYFLKLTGPVKTVTAAEEDMRKAIGIK